VWGYNQCFGKPISSREPIASLAKQKNLWDTTFSHLITQMGIELLVENEDGIRIAPGAKSRVEQILQELHTDSKGYDYRAAKTQRTTSQRGRKPKGTLDAIQSQVEQWKATAPDLSGFDVRELKDVKSRQKIQFGLWVLKKKLNVEKAPLDVVVEYVVQTFPTMGGTTRSLKSSVANQKFVGRTPQGERFLTSDGEIDIEALLPDSLKQPALSS
jgi:hypothetical protein